MWLLLLVDMAQDPAFLFYPGDYLRDTQCLSENVQVAYDRIMCEHMRNICISQSQLKFFTKKLNESEIEELKNVLTEENGNYMIKWVAESINKRRDYSDSRRKNRAKKTKEDMCNISKTYDEHMENEIENVNEIKNVIKNEKPKNWLFPGARWGKQNARFFSVFENQYGKRSVQWAIKRAAMLAGISKTISVHSLRHTYATHLLEDGVNILTIKELLGHAHVSTTMIYLHVAQINNRNKCSPLDKLEGLKVIGSLQGELIFE